MPKSLPMLLLANEMISTVRVREAPEFQVNENCSQVSTVAGVL